MIINPGANGDSGINLTGTTDQVVGFDANGKLTPVSKEVLRGPQGLQGETGPQGPAGPIYYGTCTTAADTAAKKVTKSGFSLVTGARIAVKFTYANTAANPTLNVNSTGAKPIMMYGTTPGRSGIWGAGRVVEFIYDGTNWLMENPSFAEGTGAASGNYSHAEGMGTIASGNDSHAEGGFAVAAGANCTHAEGGNCVAAIETQVLHITSYDTAKKTFTFDQSFVGFSDAFSHLEVGSKLVITNNYYVNSTSLFTVSAVNSTSKAITVAEAIPTSNFTPKYAVNISYEPETGYCTHAEGKHTIAIGNQGSHAEGNATAAIGAQSHAEGYLTEASGGSSHAEGYLTKATATAAHAEGRGTVASVQTAHAEGWGTTASHTCAHAEGGDTKASGERSHAEGHNTEASGAASHASGDHTVSEYSGEAAVGRYNVRKNAASTAIGDLFVVGKGTSDTARANAFRVDGSGVYGTAAFKTTGADYAELFEWLDGNPDGADRCGRFVTLDGEKIRLATPDDDYILGVISGNPSVVGGVHDDQWQGMYLYDIFGRPLWEDVEVPAVTKEVEVPYVHVEGEPGKQTASRGTRKEIHVICPAHTERRQKLNPDYDNTQPYQPRSQRPEWDAVGMLGKLVAVDNGTCQVNGWCTVGEGGVATHSAERTRFRVMARLDETHVRVLIM